MPPKIGDNFGKKPERDTGEEGQPSQVRKSLSLEKITSAAATSPHESTDSLHTLLDSARRKSQEELGGIYAFSRGSAEELSTDPEERPSKKQLDKQPEHLERPRRTSDDTERRLMFSTKLEEIIQEYTEGKISADMQNDKIALLARGNEHLDYYNRGEKLASNSTAFSGLRDDSIDFLKECQKYNQARKAFEDKHLKDDPGHSEFPIEDATIDALKQAENQWFVPADYSKRVAGFASTAYEWMRINIPGIAPWPEDSRYNRKTASLQTAIEKVKQATENLRVTAALMNQPSKVDRRRPGEKQEKQD